jgi:hypothetical protein
MLASERHTTFAFHGAQINRPTHVSGFLLLVGSQSRNIHWGEVLIVE